MMMFKHIGNSGGYAGKLKRMLAYYSVRRGAKNTWKKRHRIVFEKHPEYRKALDPSIQKQHRDIWKKFNGSFDEATLKICRSSSGKADPLIIPEEIFQADIEPSLNSHSNAHFLGHKSFYNRYFKPGLFPDNLLHRVDGELLDETYQPIEWDTAADRSKTFSYPVVMKPNIESWGGNNIKFIQNTEELLEQLRKNRNVVVQEKIRQHPGLAKYHEKSLNTVRVYLYRSVTDNRIHIINTVLRMGNGRKVDNVSAGGFVSLINEEGRLHGYGLDKYGEKYSRHPITGRPFKGAIPEFEALKKISVDTAQKLHLLRVVGLDLSLDVTGRWRAIEINTKAHSIRFAQYAGQPFFGQFTNEVIEYCKKNHWAKV